MCAGLDDKLRRTAVHKDTALLGQCLAILDQLAADTNILGALKYEQGEPAREHVAERLTRVHRTGAAVGLVAAVGKCVMYLRRHERIVMQKSSLELMLTQKGV